MKKLSLVVATILVMTALMLPATVLGATSNWEGNGWPVAEKCDQTAPGTTVWIWTGGTPTALTVNGVAQAGSWVQSGNGSWKFVTGWFDTKPTLATTFVTFTGDAGVLTITHGCPPPAPTPTPVPPTPTPVPPTPTPVPPTPTPPLPTPTATIPGVSQFSVEPAACRFDGDDTRLRIRVLAGLILISQLDFFIDGVQLTADDIEIIDGEAFLTVAPGLRAWELRDEATGEVLAEGETLCPTCFNIVEPTPTASQPSTDTLPGDGGGNSPLALLLILGTAAAAGLTVLTAKKGTRS